jgi:isoquinoline 1-oxidoreductase beta subunit
MVCRPPTINGTVRSVANLAAVKAMPGITDVGVISTGVAVRGHTFGQCIDAVRALQVSWGPGSVDGLSDDNVLAAVKAAELPLAIPPVAPLAETIDSEFTFYWHDNSALEPLTAVADVRSDSAEIWAAMQTPILAQQTIAQKLGLPVSAVTAHVVNAGGAFGRRMFTDVMVEAAEISKLFAKPVKLMWHRTDEFRAGRVHPLCTSRIRATYTNDSVLSFEQRHTSVATDYTQGFGEILDSSQSKLPGLNFLEFSQTVFETTVNVPYNFGAVTQLLNEVYNFDTFHSGSVRNLYSPDVVTAIELVVDQLAAKMGHDPYSFRRTFAKDDRARAVLDKVAEVGDWGRTMAPGTAQGIVLHPEYKGFNAALVEIDARPATVNRSIPDAVTGPRVTKVVFAVDVGLAVNPLGLQAQMLGGITEGIGQVLTESLHLKDGNFLEGSWDNYFFTRQWNSPLDVQIIVMPPTTGSPGGAGEFGVGTSKAAVACAYARATGIMPTSFPINHDGPLAFTPYPTVPSIPQSPTDGLQHTY